MKPYEKPRLIAISLSGADRLCGECAERGASILLVNDKSGFAELVDDLVGNGVSPLTKSEVSNLFADGEAFCRESIGYAYCKFTGAITVAWS